MKSIALKILFIGSSSLIAINVQATNCHDAHKADGLAGLIAAIVCEYAPTEYCVKAVDFHREISEKADAACEL